MRSYWPLAAFLIVVAAYFAWQRHPLLPGGGVGSAGPAAKEMAPEQIESPVAPFVINRGADRLAVRPLAHYKLIGRVLSVENYRFDMSAPLSPVDFCIAWNGLTDDKVFKQLAISQDHRWCNWQLREDFPYDNAYVNRNLANTHIIPASATIAKAAARVRRGDWVELEGELVDIKGTLDGGEFKWTSSTNREDEGGGACEVLFLTRLHFRSQVWEASLPSG